MVVTYVMQKEKVNKAFEKLQTALNNERTKLGVVLQTNPLSPSVANDVYKHAAKQAFTGLKTALSSFQSYNLNPLDKHFNHFMNTNKENIQAISAKITAYKLNKKEKPQLVQTYLNAIDHLQQTLESANEAIVTELHDQEQLQKISKTPCNTQHIVLQ